MNPNVEGPGALQKVEFSRNPKPEALSPEP